MRRNLPLLALWLVEAIVLALGAAFHLRARPALVDAFVAYGTPMPADLVLATSAWLLPSSLGLSLLVALGSLLPRSRAGRQRTLATAVVVASLGASFCVGASFLHVFRAAG